MLDINTEEYTTGESVIFNEGEAGVVGDVKISVAKKTSDDKENFPDYRIVFADKNGGELNRGIYYPDASNQKSMLNAVKLVKHITHVCNGNKDKLPLFKDEKDMIDQTMKLLREEGGKFKANVVANYGSGGDAYHKSFMEVKFFAPFFELDVDIADTALFNAKADFMTRKPQEADAGAVAFSSDAEDSGDSWD
jgi:hypothetical protein